LVLVGAYRLTWWGTRHFVEETQTMFRKLFLVGAVAIGTTLAMNPSDADARWGRRYYRGPVRVGVGYAPRVYSPYNRYYPPRRSYYGYSPRYYGYGARAYGYGPRYYSGYRGGVGVNFGTGGFYYNW
jgi:hypothetical protein